MSDGPNGFDGAAATDSAAPEGAAIPDPGVQAVAGRLIAGLMLEHYFTEGEVLELKRRVELQKPMSPEEIAALIAAARERSAGNGNEMRFERTMERYGHLSPRDVELIRAVAGKQIARAAATGLLPEKVNYLLARARQDKELDSQEQADIMEELFARERDTARLRRILEGEEGGSPDGVRPDDSVMMRALAYAPKNEDLVRFEEVAGPTARDLVQGLFPCMTNTQVSEFFEDPLREGLPCDQDTFVDLICDAFNLALRGSCQDGAVLEFRGVDGPNDKRMFLARKSTPPEELVHKTDPEFKDLLSLAGTEGGDVSSSDPSGSNRGEFHPLRGYGTDGDDLGGDGSRRDGFDRASRAAAATHVDSPMPSRAPRPPERLGMSALPALPGQTGPDDSGLASRAPGDDDSGPTQVASLVAAAEGVERVLSDDDSTPFASRSSDFEVDEDIGGGVADDPSGEDTLLSSRSPGGSSGQSWVDDESSSGSSVRWLDEPGGEETEEDDEDDQSSYREAVRLLGESPPDDSESYDDPPPPEGVTLSDDALVLADSGVRRAMDMPSSGRLDALESGSGRVRAANSGVDHSLVPGSGEADAYEEPTTPTVRARRPQTPAGDPDDAEPPPRLPPSRVLDGEHGSGVHNTQPAAAPPTIADPPPKKRRFLRFVCWSLLLAYIACSAAYIAFDHMTGHVPAKYPEQVSAASVNSFAVSLLAPPEAARGPLVLPASAMEPGPLRLLNGPLKPERSEDGEQVFNLHVSSTFRRFIHPEDVARIFCDAEHATGEGGLELVSLHSYVQEDGKLVLLLRFINKQPQTSDVDWDTVHVTISEEYP